MKIQVDIPKDLNKKLKIKKIEQELKNLQETIIFILREYFYGRNEK